MARQVGKFRITGTIGGLNFYSSDGQDLVRKAGGGFTRDAIKNMPSMEPVRHNGTEFGNLSTVKRLIRESVITSLPKLLERKWHSALVSVLTQIKAEDYLSNHGSRSVKRGLNTVEGMRLLLDFLFTPDQSLDNLLNKLPIAESLGLSYCLKDFELNKSIFKNEGTHLGLHYFVVDYDINTLTWQSYSAEKILLSKEHKTTSQLDFLISNLPPIPDFRLAFLGVALYKTSEEEMIMVNELDLVGLRCVGVFCGG
ncbi:hypothetical protein [Flavobacterium tegetincola]|uniref:hypothetical protein n=1 Tax=Flavobacterium tegetincola TaxID=150172 RepID=UPI00040C57B1|nr:hypothetical protein [Flavobacterium tegetincola]